ncbi:hypothetical protein PUN28_019047 [Cardiocondyla obscurior]|uniref:Uncharacterized protein n=1 Tax=Cardiocondyla obscurior TaxID=286306 RepID=A0AAW2EIK8_9HYME
MLFAPILKSAVVSPSSLSSRASIKEKKTANVRRTCSNLPGDNNNFFFPFSLFFFLFVRHVKMVFCNRHNFSQNYVKTQDEEEADHPATFDTLIFRGFFALVSLSTVADARDRRFSLSRPTQLLKQRINVVSFRNRSLVGRGKKNGCQDYSLQGTGENIKCSRNITAMLQNCKPKLISNLKI